MVVGGKRVVPKTPLEWDLCFASRKDRPFAVESFVTPRVPNASLLAEFYVLGK